MPNWCMNEVFICGPKEDIKKIAELFGCNNNVFSFDRFMPVPEELKGIHSGFMNMDNGVTATHWRTTTDENGNNINIPVTEEELKAIALKCGSTNWYDWCNRNWGVKWDAAMVSGVDVLINEKWNDGEIRCDFETPWGPPEGVYNELVRQFPEVNVDWFYKEPGMRLSGWLGD